MDGNYQRGANFTLESEAYILSQGKLNPIQNRFKQLRNKNLANKNHHRFVKKSGKKDDPAAAAAPGVKNMTLDADPFIYFFNMFTSNADITFINYGDIFRIKKYHKLF